MRAILLANATVAIRHLDQHVAAQLGDIEGDKKPPLPVRSLSWSWLVSSPQCGWTPSLWSVAGRSWPPLADLTPPSSNVPMCYGLEFVAAAVKGWISGVGAKAAFIEPGNP